MNNEAAVLASLVRLFFMIQRRTDGANRFG
jgi:hypothetical protein